jgi:hypothetical protein
MISTETAIVAVDELREIALEGLSQMDPTDWQTALRRVIREADKSKEALTKLSETITEGAACA